MTDEELKELAKLECKKLLKSEKGYSDFWCYERFTSHIRDNYVIA